jgi:guanylate kinase
MSRKPSSVSLFMPGCSDQGEFIEHAVFAGNMYGTSKAAVEAVRSKGQHFIIILFLNILYPDLVRTHFERLLF